MHTYEYKFSGMIKHCSELRECECIRNLANRVHGYYTLLWQDSEKKLSNNFII